jgi:hypothetical protein
MVRLTWKRLAVHLQRQDDLTLFTKSFVHWN